MAQNTGRIQSKLYRFAYLGGIAIFFFPVLEPFLPLVFTIAGSLVLGGLVRFIFSLLVNRKLNQTYRAYTSSNTRRPNGSDGSSGSNDPHTERPGANTPPSQQDDPLKPYRTLLGLPSGFSRGQLKAAYRAMAAQYHPDRYEAAPTGERQKAEEMMKKINDAYNMLYAIPIDIIGRTC
jgi:hypothetical protein